MDAFDSEFSEKARQVRNLFEDISTVNLLNGLYLSTDQMKKILALAKKHKKKNDASAYIRGWTIICPL
jgi:flagellar biosynthesis/type III secretory pathway chaperone